MKLCSVQYSFFLRLPIVLSLEHKRSSIRNSGKNERDKLLATIHGSTQLVSSAFEKYPPLPNHLTSHGIYYPFVFLSLPKFIIEELVLFCGLLWFSPTNKTK